jgi:hypothetical protein
MIQLRAIGPSDEIAVLIQHLRALTGVEVASISGPMSARTSGASRFYLSAILAEPRPIAHESR